MLETWVAERDEFHPSIYNAKLKEWEWVHHLSNSKARMEDIEIGLVLSCTAILLLLEWDRDEYIDIYIRPYRAVETSMRYENTAKFLQSTSSISSYLLLYTSHMLSRGKTRMIRPERGGLFYHLIVALTRRHYCSTSTQDVVCSVSMFIWLREDLST